MQVFRISRSKYAGNLTASGAANRWNLANELVIYTGASRSLSTLELVVHRNAIKPHDPYKMMIIDIPSDVEIEKIEASDLPGNWRTLSAYHILQQVGSLWYNARKTAICQIPSVVIPQEYNYIIHTQHEDFSKISLANTEPFFWDRRLL